MLVAEIHGKTVEAARDAEDYLTSTVFGHLRYVGPALFWTDLLTAARGLPGPRGEEAFLGRVLVDAKTEPGQYERVAVRFWLSHPTLGEPDLLLVFSGGTQLPLVVLIEAKLWAGKSGTGEDDQLVRYLRILDDLAAVGIRLPPGAGRYLVYLTPRESLAEVEDSLTHAADPEGERGRLFRLRWQDVLVAARQAAKTAPEPDHTILTDVAAFLGRLGLEYFDRFNKLRGLPMLAPSDGAIFRDVSTPTPLMTRLPELEPVTARRASWAT